MFTFPPDYKTKGCYLVPIDKALIPLVAGALRLFELRRNWESDEDFELGYNAFAELQSIMTKLCLEQFLESQNRIYRLVDAGLFGRVYINAGTVEEPDITPAIPLTPNIAYVAPGLLERAENLRSLLENALLGYTSPNYADPRGIKQQLDEIITALQSGDSLDDDMLAQLQIIAGLLA